MISPNVKRSISVVPPEEEVSARGLKDSSWLCKTDTVRWRFLHRLDGWNTSGRYTVRQRLVCDLLQRKCPIVSTREMDVACIE